MGNGNRPTPEFRREPVRLALTSGRTRPEVAEDLGIGLSTLKRWLSLERDANEPSEVPADLHATRTKASLFADASYDIACDPRISRSWSDGQLMTAEWPS